MFVTEETDCTYDFVWKTPKACAPFLDDQCTVFDASTSTLFDLSGLAVVHGSVAVPSSGDTFQINVCSQAVAPHCDASAGVCLVHHDGTSVNLGRFNTAALGLTAENHLLLTYTNGDECPDSTGRIQTLITLICDSHAFHDLPRFDGVMTSADTCSYKFTWATCHACAQGCPATTAAPTMQTTSSNSLIQPQHSSGSGVGTAMIVLLVLASVALLVFVLISEERRERVRSFFGRPRAPPRFQYKKLRTSELPDNALVESEDSDDSDDSMVDPKKEFLIAVNK